MECQLWAESVPTRIASGRTGVRVQGRGLLGPLNVDTGRPVALKNARLVQMKTNAPTGPGRQSLSMGSRLAVPNLKISAFWSGPTATGGVSLSKDVAADGRSAQKRSFTDVVENGPIRQLPRLARRRWVGQSPSLRGARRQRQSGRVPVAGCCPHEALQLRPSSGFRPANQGSVGPDFRRDPVRQGGKFHLLMGLRHRRAAWPEVAWPRDRSRGE